MRVQRPLQPLLAAGAPKLPHVLLDQMALGGRLVIPLIGKDAWKEEGG